MHEYPFDIFDDATKADPYPHFARMRELTPAIRNPALFGAVMVHRQAEANVILRDPEHFSSAPTPLRLADFDPFRAPTMLTSDPPDHTRLRGLVSRAFTPRAVATLEERLRHRVADLIAPLRDGAPFDAVDELASALPVIAIAELLGVPSSDQGDFRAWSDDLVAGAVGFTDSAQLARSHEATDALRTYLSGQIRSRRDAPSDDLIGRLVEANADHQLDDAELLASCVLLLVAGNETTTNLIANLMLALGRHPDERRKLIESPGLAADAVEEAARYDAPVQATVRTVVGGPVSVAGDIVDPGQLVLLLIGAANRDPARFDRADAFDISRHDAASHLGFGQGIHFCLGAGLARLEARVAITELNQMAPSWDVVADAPLSYDGSFIFRRPSHLWIC